MDFETYCRTVYLDLPAERETGSAVVRLVDPQTGNLADGVYVIDARLLLQASEVEGT